MSYAQHLRLIRDLGLSEVVLVDHGLPEDPKRIDVWWRGRKNGSLMAILAYLLTLNYVWSRARIRVIKMVDEGSTAENAESQLEGLIEAARLEADYLVLPPGDIAQALAETSGDADLVMLGFRPPEDEDAQRFHENYSRLVAELPTTMLVCSTGAADLTS